MPYKLTRRGKVVWRGQVYLPDGRTKQCQFETRKEAAQWEAMFNPVTPPQTSAQCPTLLEWMEAYLGYCIRYVPKTTNDKINVFRRFCKGLHPHQCVTTITRAMALAYLQSQFQKRTGYAANKDRKNLAAAWAWGVDYLDGFPAANPFKAVRKFPETRNPRYVPPEDDFWKVVDVAEGQDKVFLLAMLYLAARKGELFRLTWADIDFARNQVRLTTRKRQDGSMEAEYIPMVDDLWNVLLEHRKNAVNEYVFVQSVGRHTGKPYTENRGFPQDICEKAEVKPFGCHAIRHLTASILAANDVPMVVIQAILRHKKLSTTERYVRRLDGVKPYMQLLQGGRERTRTYHEEKPRQRQLPGFSKGL